jgi:type IV pilus assembly protein PilY1
MKSSKNRVILILGLLMTVMLVLGPDVRADDVDVYMTTVQNTALVVADDSGSMSFPVYDSTMDYANFMWWMRSEDLATDNKTLGENLLGDRKSDDNYWDKDKGNFNPNYPDRTDHQNHEYDRLDPDQIYLVSATSRSGFTLINYIDKNGDPQQKAQVGDFMEHWGDSHNERDDYLDNPVLVIRNASGDVWKLPEVAGADEGTESGGEIPIDLDLDIASLSIETVKDTTDGNYYVVYPTTVVDICEDELPEGCKTADKWYTVTWNYAGDRLKNAQDVQVTNLVADPRTGIVTDHGLLGHLRSAGYYFAGLFEQSGGAIDLTHSAGAAELENGLERVYLFVTGNFLNFIKVVEDFDAKNRTVNPPGVPSFAYDWAWPNICDKSAGTNEPNWSSQSTTVYSHDPVSPDYNNYAVDNYGGSPVGDFYRATITPPGSGETAVAAIKVRFSYVDTEWCFSGTDNDYVELQDANGNSLLAIKGQEVKSNGRGGSGAAVSYDGGQTWTNTTDILDQDGYTEPLYTTSIRVMWHKGKSGKTCSGSDKGFKIRGFKFTTQTVAVTGTEAGNFYCMNGEDGYGRKIRTRNEIAKEVLHKVIDATSNSLIWGFNSFNSSPEAQLGSTVDQVKAAVDSLGVSGGTPLSGALQDGYENNYSFFSNAANADEAECANKFIILMTDGYPNGDNDWDRINVDGSPVFNNTSNEYVDNDNWVGLDGNTNYGDDVATWLHDKDNKGWATYKHTVHTIGFGIDHPLLQDMADSSDGIYITAFNEGQLINAFHSLSLAMTESQSFVAPVVSVDQANRTQSGDKIYTAFFRPLEDDYWVGNLKKYGLKLMTRSECGRTTSEWVVVDGDNQAAVDCFGNFYPTSKSIWSKVADGGEAAKGGVGALLKDAMPGTHPIDVPATANVYDFRNIYTYDSDTSSMVRFIDTNITNEDLGVVDEYDRYDIINFMYGYTYGHKTGTSKPAAKREWILGDMVHSEPTIVDYLDEGNSLEARFIVAGANDGLLHVFTDQAITLTNAAGKSENYEAGREIWAFIPEDLLPNLRNFGDPSLHYYFVDGFSSLYRSRSFNDDNPAGFGGVNNGIRDADEYYNKTLVFSERRGGNSYWALDVSKPNPMQWTVKWQIQGGGTSFTNPYSELEQTWSKPIFSRIQTGVDTFTDVVVFAGGYDHEEDGYPEVWEDDDEDGIKDAGESHTDTVGGTASTYDYFNPDMNEHGRGIYVVDLETGEPVFRALNGVADAETTYIPNSSPTYNFTAMKWSFPADTTVIPLNLYRTATDYGYRKLVIYAPDVYGNIWKVVYDYLSAGETNKKWQARRIFSSNPGSNQSKAMDAITTTPTTVSTDQGRKMFYPPDVSYRGTSWTDYPTLFVGTGDRPHPRYMAFNPATGTGYHDRFYVVADTENENKPSDDATYPLNETYLLNLTCDEFEAVGDVDQDGVLSPTDTDDDSLRVVLRNILFHNPDADCSDPDCDYPVNGQYARGWYRIMGKQGDCTQDSRDHHGEKVLSRPTLFYKVAYFTTFQPYFGDPCRPSGDALLYALDYDVGTAAFNLNLANDSADIVEDLSDTYAVVEDSTIASGVRVITRGGKAAGVFSAGGSIVGAGEKDGTGTSTSIPGPPGGASKIMWETF